jgi:hypothetical protein
LRWLKFPAKDSKVQFLKMLDDLKEDSSKQKNEIKKSIQDLGKKFNLDTKFNHLDEKLSKEMGILKKQMEILEMKSS